MNMESRTNETRQDRIEEFRSILEKEGLPVDQWTGEGGTKTVEDLYKEVDKGETQLTFTKSGEILRVVNTIAADIYARDPETDMLYRLKEDRQVSKIDGSVKKRPYLKGAVAEKRESGESIQQAVIRGIKEELGIEDERALTIGEIDLFTDERQTKTYPGLNSQYNIYKVRVDLAPEAFQIEGYKEEQETKTTYFVWEEVDETREDMETSMDPVEIEKYLPQETNLPGRPTEDLAEQEIVREKIQELLNSGRLTKRESKVLELRFGLIGGKDRTYKEVGKRMGVTASRARQLVERALLKSRHPKVKEQLGTEEIIRTEEQE